MLLPDAGPDVARAVASVTRPGRRATPSRSRPTSPRRRRCPASGRTLERWDLLARLAAADLTTARVVEAHLDAVAILAEAQAAGVETPAAAARHDVGRLRRRGPWRAPGRPPDADRLAGHRRQALVLARRAPHPRPGHRARRRRAPPAGRRPALSGRHRARGHLARPRPDRRAVGPGDVRRRRGRAGRRPRLVPAPARLRPRRYRGGRSVVRWRGGRGPGAVASRRAPGARPGRAHAPRRGRPRPARRRHRAARSRCRRRRRPGRRRRPASCSRCARDRWWCGRPRRCCSASGTRLGPAPLALDDAHARRVADLTVYLRQHHAERDSAALGRALLDHGRLAVVTFRHDAAGHAGGAVGRRGAACGSCPRSRPTPRSCCVAAHPDDETLGAGGLLALTARAGVDVDVVVATDGEASHPDSPTLLVGPTSPAGAPRRSSRRSRCSRLNARLHLLHLPDGELARHEHGAGAGARAIGGQRLLASSRRGVGTPTPTTRRPVASRPTWLGDRRRRAARVPGLGVALGRPGDVRLPWPTAVRPAAGRRSARPPSREPCASTARRSSRCRRGRATRSCSARRCSRTSGAITRSSSALPQRVPAAIAGACLDAPFFDDFYAANGDDPWGFTDRWYERRKRALTLAALPRERFRPRLRAGLLDRRAHGRAGRPLRRPAGPRSRCGRGGSGGRAHCGTSAQRRGAPGCRAGGLARRCRSTSSCCRRSATTAARTTWRGWSTAPRSASRTTACSSPATGATRSASTPSPVTRCTRRCWPHPRLALLARHLEDDFRLDVLVRPPARSVARADGALRERRAPRHRGRRRRAGPRRGGAAAGLPRRHRRCRAAGCRARHGGRRRSTAALTARRTSSPRARRWWPSSATPASSARPAPRV